MTLRLHGEKNLQAGWLLLLGGVFAAAGLDALHILGDGLPQGRPRECLLGALLFALLGGIGNVAYGLTIDRAILRDRTKVRASWAALGAGAMLPIGCLAAVWVPSIDLLRPLVILVFAAALAVLVKGLCVPCCESCAADPDESR